MDGTEQSPIYCGFIFSLFDRTGHKTQNETNTMNPLDIPIRITIR